MDPWYKVHISQFSLIGLQTMEKFEFTFWVEVDQTFDSKEVIILIFVKLNLLFSVYLGATQAVLEQVFPRQKYMILFFISETRC